MAHFAGLDVSVAETSICIVDEHGKIARERKVPTEPEAIIEALNGSGQACERIGLEAGPLSQWLYGELAEACLPVICIETRHIRAVLEAQVNKTDRNVRAASPR
jgi:transposase